jgi:phospholipid/cholesterol/gamma-HCH transport system substrate-binding protein
MTTLRKFLVPTIVVVLVLATALTLFRGEDRKTLTAHFPRTISVYEGSDVRVLGVPIGQVDKVTPSGTDVVVTMSYDAETRIPADAKAVIIAPSIVGDRYVQLTPAFTEEDDVLPSGAELDEDRTAVPLELDQIYSSIDDLTVALGPTGANKNGALTDLLESTAKNFGGQGEKFHQTIEDFSKLSATLDDNKEELFGSAAELEGFINTLAENDQTVRTFNQSLADVSTMLAGERTELAASLKNLAVAMTQVSSFVRDNREILGKNIRGLNRVSKVLVKQRSSLDEILTNAPVALNNLYLTYNPQSGTLDTRANQGQLGQQIGVDPAAFLCSVVSQADRSGEACNQIEEALPQVEGAASQLGQILPRTGTCGRGGPQPWQDRFDPSLGGLVEVSR